MAKPVREVDRIKWKSSMPVLAFFDTEVVLNSTVKELVLIGGQTTSDAIQNMMQPLDL